MKKMFKAVGISVAFLALIVGAMLFALSKGSNQDDIRTERNMSEAEQREVLQMFFASPLPKELKDVRIESSMPAQGDGEVRASFRVTPAQAKALVSKLGRSGRFGEYTSEAFAHAKGFIRVDRSGRVEIQWSEY